MGDTWLTLRGDYPSPLLVSVGLKLPLIPGITVSGGLPYRGRDRVIPRWVYRRARRRTPVWVQLEATATAAWPAS